MMMTRAPSVGGEGWEVEGGAVIMKPILFQNTPNKHPYLTGKGEVWYVFCEFKD